MSDMKYVPVDPVYRIPDMAIDVEKIVHRGLEKFESFQSDRFDWLKRRETYFLQWDDYVTPIRTGLFDSSSNFHMPLTEIQCSAMHARLMQSVFFINPNFFVDPQEDLDFERIKKIELMMRYIIYRYANHHLGIYNAIHDFFWDLCTDGIGILSRGWDVKQRRFLSIEKNPEFQSHKNDLERLLGSDMDFDEFSDKIDELKSKPFIEKQYVRTVFNGPIVVAEDPINVLFKGDVVDATNLNEHETVMQVCYFTRDQLIAAKQRDYMGEDEVDEILSMPADIKGSSSLSSRTSTLNFLKDKSSGVRTNNPLSNDDKYEFLKVYDNVCLGENEKSTLSDRIIYYIHPNSRQMPRWTFLDRVVSDGKIPLHMAHLYRRPRRAQGRGMVETQYPINEVSDILMNQSIDAGMLANNPMFAYRSDSSFDPGEIKVEPGLGIKTDDPNQDLRFFTFNVNPNWSMNIQAMIQGLSHQLTALGPQSSGQVGGKVGPLRSTSGVRELLGQSDIQLDVVIKPAGLCISELFNGLYADSIDRMPERMKISVLGFDGKRLSDEDGKPLMVEITREELSRKINFGLYANSTNMNRSQQKENSVLMLQTLINEVSMRSGIITPEKIYNLYDNFLENIGTPVKDRFIAKPQGYSNALPMALEIAACAQGIVPTIVMADPEHEIKIQQYDVLLNSPQAQMEKQYGIIHEKAFDIMKLVKKKHEDYFAMIQSAQASQGQMQNPTGSNISLNIGQGQDGESGEPDVPRETRNTIFNNNQQMGEGEEVQ